MRIRAKVEHPLRVLKRQFGYTKVRYEGAEEKHATTENAVCAIEPVDGAPSMHLLIRVIQSIPRGQKDLKPAHRPKAKPGTWKKPNE